MIADHPIVGSGLATFPFAYERYTGEDPSTAPPFAHNLFLNFAVETGILGLAALLFFIGTGTAAIVRWHKRSPQGSAERAMSAIVLAALVALLGHQLVDGTIMGVHISFALFALLALGAALDRLGRRTPA